MQESKDKNGNVVRAGMRVRLLSLSGNWFEEIPPDEKSAVLSMIGEVFEVEEIDEYGHPWICKWWPGPSEQTSRSHSVALESHEIELVV